MSDTESSSNEPGPAPGTASLAYLEGLYARYLEDPASLDPSWRSYFDAFAGRPASGGTFTDGPKFKSHSIFSLGNGASSPGAAAGAAQQDRVDELIRGYRVRGHLLARFDPLGLPRSSHPELDPAYYGLGEADMDQRYSTNTLAGHKGAETLREILDHLRVTYCRSIGAQFMHIDNLEIKRWLQDRMEEHHNRIELSRQEQMRILIKLTDAVLFEEFIQKKYVGAKRFSLEGAESLIPLLDMAITRAADNGVRELVIGMAHRGRLNVLANIIGKRQRVIFHEFEDSDPELHLGKDDVKYHLGHTSSWITANAKRVKLSLCFNPSHLEFVNAVALGRMRAKQDRMGEDAEDRGMVILIHGDAAFAGQGIIQETLNMSELAGYRSGGTLHVIVNNQIGFTTSMDEARSTRYASAVARMLQIPIWHVNGEDPEAVAQVVTLADDFRMRFKRDAVIDMYCYRRHGHNEGDDPAFTHPVMYEAIRKRPTILEGYRDRLVALGGITRGLADDIAAKRRGYLDKELEAARSDLYKAPAVDLGPAWRGYVGGAEEAVPEVETGLDAAQISGLMEGLCRVPESFEPHPKIRRWLDRRLEMAAGELPLDWGAGEALALGSLAVAGHPIRISGQDSARGTFSHRHAVLHDYRDGAPYSPLQHLSPGQAPVEVINSPLSENGVLGFEYGYSLEAPEALVAWEAQFGDFVNAAQVFIDQFIASAEDKWNTLSGLTLLLPHGYEGQGPEHSSARIERFLTLAAEENMQLVNPTTPAQYFHVLRRQVLSPWRKPLIVFTPKSLLRLPEAVSEFEDFAASGFQRILGDEVVDRKREVNRVLLCSGKVYYDLDAERTRRGRDDVAILRLEQLYPLSEERLAEALAQYADGTPVFWVQEEPENMGAWRHMLASYGRELDGRLPFSGIYREASASPATGFPSSHKMEQGILLMEAFADD